MVRITPDTSGSCFGSFVLHLFSSYVYIVILYWSVSVSGESLAELYSEAMFLLLKHMDVFLCYSKSRPVLSIPGRNTIQLKQPTAVFVFVWNSTYKPAV